MSSSADVNLIVSLGNVTALINRYFGMFIFIFGTIGNVLNCLVFSQRALRSSPCAFLFLVSSIANVAFTITGLFARMLTGWLVDVSNTIGWLCKFRGFVLYTSRTIGLWLIMLATVDRWLSSSSNVRYRHMSTIRNTYRHIILILSLSALLYAYLFYCYDANLSGTPIPCYPRTTLCRVITDMFDVCITVLMPIILMMIFGVMIISNVRASQRRTRALPMSNLNSGTIVTAMNPNPQQQRSKKIDRHLLVMLLFQITVLTLLSVPYCCMKIYSTLTSTVIKTPLQNATEGFVFNFLLNLAFLSCGAPFYIYTLCGGSVFRNELLNIVKYVGRKMRCLPN